jgi:citrate synthase
LYLLLTGELPTEKDTKDLSQELARRGVLGREAESVIDALPTTMHPMTQLSIGVLALQPQSLFAQAYSEGVHKNKLWHYALDDSLNLIAKLPALAARIYRNVYKSRKHIERDPKLDWSANYARMLGFDKNPAFVELMRLYLTLHADHEGGNVSAHATHLVGSTLADPYYSFAGGMTGLAGPLHGLANQEVLNWMLEMQAAVGKTPSDADVEKYIWDTLNAGRVVPGFGHAVLRKTDPRYIAQRQYALKHLPNDPLFKLVGQMFEIAPKVLTKQGKVSNPFPNVDAHSGCLLVHYGMTEQNYYTVMFGVSRALGVLAQYVWSRALGFPLERPKSVTTEWLEKNISKFEKK